MKQYMLFVHYVEGQEPPAPETMQQMFDDVAAFNESLQAEGAWIFAGGLLPPETSTVVRAQGGDVLTTDGPFAEPRSTSAGSGSSPQPARRGTCQRSAAASSAASIRRTLRMSAVR